MNAATPIISSTRRCHPAPTAPRSVPPGLARSCRRSITFSPELLIVSAGFDAHKADPLAQLRLETSDFAWVTTELVAIAERHTGGRIVSVLEGGYDLHALAASAAAHVRVLMRAD